MFKRILITILTIVMLIPTSIYASQGESGYFGGVSDGVKLPKSLNQQINSGKKNKKEILNYKEMIFVTGVPIEVAGTIIIERDTSKVYTDVNGKYTEKYTIIANNHDNSAILERVVVLETMFVRTESDYSYQVNRNTTVKSWNETLKVGGTEYVVDETLSGFGRGENIASYIEDKTPGISYYNGNISYNLIYMNGDKKFRQISVSGETYGFNQPWSKVENQKFMMDIEGFGDDNINMTVEVKPFIKSYKTISYDDTEPFPISFAGSYKQLFITEGGLEYSILTNHPQLTQKQKKGKLLLKPRNDFEKLRLPRQMTYVSDGDFAQGDIQKLMSMDIIEESPLDYQPHQVISRGDFVKMLCKSMNIIPDQEFIKNSKKRSIVFADIDKNHPLYYYTLKAYDAKLVQGVGLSEFKPEKPLKREEAFTLLIRVIGLERLGANKAPMTKFLDDSEISAWAKEAIYAGNRIGIFKGNNGEILPKKPVTKAESAAIVNRLIDYLRKDIVNNYKQY